MVTAPPATTYGTGPFEYGNNLGSIISLSGNGIEAIANNSGGSGDVLVDVDKTGTVYGYTNGIVAGSYGHGDVTVLTDRTITGKTGHGVYGAITNADSLGDVTIKVTDDVTGASDGIRAIAGDGVVDILADAAITWRQRR